MGLGSVLGGVAGVIGGVIGLNESFKKDKSADAIKDANRFQMEIAREQNELIRQANKEVAKQNAFYRKIAEEQNAIARAIAQRNVQLGSAFTDPDSKLIANLAAGEEGRFRRSFAEGLRDFQISERRAAARGLRTVDPTRRDEAIAQAFARGAVDAREQARAAAREFLVQAAAINNQQPAFASPSFAAMNTNLASNPGGVQAATALAQIEQANRARRMGGIEGMVGAIGALGTILDQQGNKTYTPPYNPAYGPSVYGIR